jgi:hypothetical protein
LDFDSPREPQEDGEEAEEEESDSVRSLAFFCDGYAFVVGNLIQFVRLF